MNKTASGAAAIEKSLALFQRILRDDGQTALPQLAADLALPRSTLYRLTGALEDAGLIHRLETGRYITGIGLLAQVGGLSAASQLVRLARPLLKQLAQSCGATAHLGIMEKDMVTYLVKESAPGAKPILTRETAQLEAYCSGIGKVLLAWQNEAERERYLAGGPFIALTAQTITDPGALRASLAAVREAGFARDDGEVLDEIRCLAVPVRLDDGPPIAGISVSFAEPFYHRDSEAAQLGRLQRCARALEEKIGRKTFFL
jgi:DNA-binding IclR family transcriptional regulator